MPGGSDSRPVAPLTWQRRGLPRGRARGADDRRRPAWASWSSCHGPYGSHVSPCPSIDNREADAGKLVIVHLTAPGLPAAVLVVPTIDGGQGQRRGSWSSLTWQRATVPRGSHGSHVSPCRWKTGKLVIVHPAAVPVVPTIDAGEADAGKVSAGEAGHRAAVPAARTCRREMVSPIWWGVVRPRKRAG